MGTTISDFYCPVCSYKMMLPRKTGQARARGHRKWLWCPGCMKKRNFLEIREEDISRNMLGEIL